jgi:DNA (cytosine-5)-methyltransferase 1
MTAPKAGALPDCATPRRDVSLSGAPFAVASDNVVRGTERQNTARTDVSSPGIVPELTPSHYLAGELGRGLRYIDVCSGISAPTMAWKPLGWHALCFAEIEAAPRSVLAHHYPDVPLRGDFTEIEGTEYGPVDLLVGGTPCQSFSIAGLRGGLGDDRGNLALEFARLADRARPRWVVWENVPGVLSSNGGSDFGSILGALAELGYGVAYRVLDAQHFGVPQRRRRVFVVGYLGDWRRAAAVLFERHGLSGHSAPSREKGQNAPTIPSRSTGGGGLGTDFDCDGGLIADTAPCLNAAFGSKLGLDNQHIDSGAGLFVAHSLRAEGFDASEDGTGRGTPLVPVCFSAKDHGADAMHDMSPTLRAGGHSGSHANAGVMPAVAFVQNSRDEVRIFGGDGQTVGALAAEPGMKQQSYVAASAVRRLTPRECERLQGFPDDFTLVPHRGKPMADGPRYKCLGNSMAVPVLRWIGERIDMVEQLEARSLAA